MSKVRAPFFLLTLAMLQFASLGVAWAADKPVQYRLESHLIWATDYDKPDDPRLKELNDSLRAKMGAAKFRWKNYWEVDKKNFTVAAGATNKIVISKTCDLEIKHLDKESFEVKLFGEKKTTPVIHRMRESLADGRALVLGGDDKHESAWFVVLMLTPVSSTASPQPTKPAVEAGKTNKPSADGPKKDRSAVDLARATKPVVESSEK